MAGGSPLERDLLRAAGMAFVEVASWDSILESIAISGPAVVLLSLPLALDHETGLVRAIIEHHRGLPVIVVAEEANERRIVASLKAGASGYLVRADLDTRLVSAIAEALDGGVPMSRAAARIVLSRARRESTEIAAVSSSAPPAMELASRKVEILEMLARGLSYEQIALALGISVNTVRSHVRDIYTALGASTKVEAVLIAIERGLLKSSWPPVAGTS